MDSYLKEREIQRKREYHREWRKNHPDADKAAQVRYWTKKAEEMRQAAGNKASVETRYSMATSGVNVKMGVSGVQQFKQDMQQSKQAVKTVDAQLALSEKQFKQRRTNLLDTTSLAM